MFLKTLTYSLLILLASAATDRQACMYCKRADTKSGFLNSFTYCPDKEAETCIQNFGDYIQQGKKCIKDTKDGWELDIDKDCNAETVQAPACISSFTAPPPNDDGTPTKVIPITNKILPENGKCTMKIDATAQVARVKLTGNNLGVLFPGYIIDQPITVPQGKVKYLTIYNG